MGDLGSLNPGVAFDGNTSLSSTTVANPCGLIAKYMFDDRYTLYKSDGGNFSKNSIVGIDETNIAHSVDKNYKFKAPVGASHIQWHDVTDGKDILFIFRAFDGLVLNGNFPYFH